MFYYFSQQKAKETTETETEQPTEASDSSLWWGCRHVAPGLSSSSHHLNLSYLPHSRKENCGNQIILSISLLLHAPIVGKIGINYFINQDWFWLKPFYVVLFNYTIIAFLYFLMQEPSAPPPLQCLFCLPLLSAKTDSKTKGLHPAKRDKLCCLWTPTAQAQTLSSCFLLVTENAEWPEAQDALTVCTLPKVTAGKRREKISIKGLDVCSLNSTGFEFNSLSLFLSQAK